MKAQDADEIITQLKTKIQKGERLARKELLPLLLTPLMSGDSSIRTRIEKAQQMIKPDYADINNQDKNKMQAILFTFALKLLDKYDKEKIKEDFGMTDLGEMIWDMGYEDGNIAKLVQLIRRKMNKGLSCNEIADILEEEISIIEMIYHVINTNKNFDDKMIAKEIKDSLLIA